jgi:hypothetical protein
MMLSIANNPILTAKQKRFLLTFRDSPLSKVYYLTGGTALSAFYLQHRRSEDLDFFSQELVPLEIVIDFIHSLPGVIKVQFDRKFDRRIFLVELEENQTIKTEFTLYPFPRLEKDIIVDGVLVDSLQDILVNKVMALTDRMDAKDYVDLYFAVQKHPAVKIERLIEDAGKKFGVSGVGHIMQGRFLGDIPSPKGLYLTELLSPETLEAFFRNQVKSWIARRLSTDPDLWPVSG